MQPTEHERDRIHAWLESKDFKCPCCGQNDDFGLGGTIGVPNLSATAELESAIVAYFFTVKCNRCAFVSLFSPEIMRIPVDE